MGSFKNLKLATVFAVMGTGANAAITCALQLSEEDISNNQAGHVLAAQYNEHIQNGKKAVTGRIEANAETIDVHGVSVENAECFTGKGARLEPSSEPSVYVSEMLDWNGTLRAFIYNNQGVMLYAIDPDEVGHREEPRKWLPNPFPGQ